MSLPLSNKPTPPAFRKNITLCETIWPHHACTEKCLDSNAIAKNIIFPIMRKTLIPQTKHRLIRLTPYTFFSRCA